MIGYQVTGIEMVRRRFIFFGKLIVDRTPEAIIKGATAVRNEIFYRAPVDTGAYRNSIKLLVEDPRTRGSRQRAKEGEYSVIIYSPHPAANRLEYGFVGSDSLGRSYSQAPQPHWRPAFAISSQVWPETFSAQVLEWLKASK